MFKNLFKKFNRSISPSSVRQNLVIDTYNINTSHNLARDDDEYIWGSRHARRSEIWIVTKNGEDCWTCPGEKNALELCDMLAEVNPEYAWDVKTIFKVYDPKDHGIGQGGRGPDSDSAELFGYLPEEES